jgi:SHS family lactate transporter-like MFS transporter
LSAVSQLRGLTGPQWRAFAAAYLGWMLDAFDYFLLVLLARYIATDFGTGLKQISYAIGLTLAMRPVGALVFGLIADRFGRKPALMGSILLYAGAEFLTGFAPSLGALFVMRAVFGIGMGGEWGVGASLAMESVPAASRGLLSGVLQQGYPAGYLLAALVAGHVFPHVGWRATFMLGSLPAALVLYVRKGVRESPAWLEERASRNGGDAGGIGAVWATVRARWPLFLYMVLLMTAFNSFSHGTQDLYPSGFLGKQRGLAIATISNITIVGCLGAISGGIMFGALSQRFGRRRTIAAAALLSLPMIPLWVGPTSVAGLAAGAFLMQFAVQGAWGVVPAHLNELSPGAVRGTFPGLAYQLGNLCASSIVPLQATLAESGGWSFASALGWFVGVVGVVLAIVALLGPEASRDAGLAPGAA